MTHKIIRNGFDEGLMERTKLFATEAHKDQVRKNGSAFITHPERVCRILAKRETEDFGPAQDFYYNYNITIALAWLHDVVEDTEFTLEEVEVLYGKEISERLDVLTRRDNETYLDYGNRISCVKDRLVKLVKLADLEDNLGSVGDGAFPKEKEDRLRIRWEWLQYKIGTLDQ